MLVLSRKRGEVITVGDNIRITLVEIGYGKAKIGISAPIDMPVHRLEVHEAIKREERRRNGNS